MKKIKELDRDELNSEITEMVKKIRGANTEKERKPYQKRLNKLIKEFNHRGYGIFIFKK